MIAGREDAVRFDDSLTTVLATDTASAPGAQTAWRQLVDFAGRGHGDGSLLARLAALRSRVPLTVRVASARGLASEHPSAALVAFMALDDVAVAAPVLRAATLSADEWLALLPRLSPPARGVLRHRRDLPDAVARGLESFGSTDFVIAHAAAPASEPLPPAVPMPTEPALPVAPDPAPPSDIADLVARIDAFQRTRPVPEPTPPVERPSDQFRFATDPAGVIRWVDGVARGPLVGVTLARAGQQGMVTVDAIAASALAALAGFRDARLTIGGDHPAAGDWALAGRPSFEPDTGRFAGISGIARRISTPVGGSGASAQLRQLVHELRTPATAIAGFAELIGSELLGPVAPVHRDRARLIERQAGELVDAIEDLDTAARLEGDALPLSPEPFDLAALVQRAAADLRATATTDLSLDLVLAPAAAFADRRAAERLVARLLATVITMAAPGERLRIQVSPRTRTARVAITRPRAFAAAGQDRLLSLAPAPEGSGPLLGLPFSLKLFADVAKALGGRFAVEPDRLTLRLPLAQVAEVAAADLH